MKTIPLMPLFAILALLLVAGCGQQTVTESVSPTASPVPSGQPAAAPVPEPSVTPPLPAVQQPAPVKEFNVEAKKFKFDPSTITVKQGDTVKLHVSVPADDTAHGLAIKEFDVNANLEPGKTTTVEFTADKAGTFPFFCAVYCGEGHSNMRGKLVVEP